MLFFFNVFFNMFLDALISRYHCFTWFYLYISNHLWLDSLKAYFPQLMEETLFFGDSLGHFFVWLMLVMLLHRDSIDVHHKVLFPPISSMPYIIESVAKCMNALNSDRSWFDIITCMRSEAQWYIALRQTNTTAISRTYETHSFLEWHPFASVRS